MSRLLSFLLFLLFLSLLMIEARGEGPVKLPGSFIDSTSSPLIISGKTFPGSVIYQNNLIYAPAVDFINMLGISSNLQNLPEKIELNGKSAPLSILATGPDRYTGQAIYYLNVTDTMNFLGMNYELSGQGKEIRITVNRTEGIPSSAGGKGSISLHVVTDKVFHSGTVTVTEEYLNSARIPAIRTVASSSLSSEGTFTLPDLPAGKYSLTVCSTATSQSELFYSPVMNDFYYQITFITSSWNKNISLKTGEKANLTLETKDAVTGYSHRTKFVSVDTYVPGRIYYNPYR